MTAAKVVQDQIDAFNARDAEAFAACYAPDATVLGPDGNVMVQGREAIHGLYSQLFAQSCELHVEIPARLEIGDWVIDEEQASGLVFDGFPPELHAAIIYRVETGLIAQAQMLT